MRVSNQNLIPNDPIRYLPVPDDQYVLEREARVVELTAQVADLEAQLEQRDATIEALTHTN